MNCPTAFPKKELLGQIELLITKIEQLAEVSPHVKQSDCILRMRKLASELHSAPEHASASISQSLYYTPCWQDLPSTIEDMIAKVKQVNRITKPYSDEPQALRAICQPQACTPGPSQTDVDDVLIALASEEIAVAIAQGVVDAIPQTVSVLGNDVPNPAYYIALAVKVALEIAAKGTALAAAILQRAANIRAACEENAFQQVVFDMCATLNEVKSSLDSLHDKVDLLDKKVNILLTLIVELTKAVEEIYHLELEQSLAQCESLVSLYLPNIADGNLTDVQKLVDSLVNASINAGLNVGNAASLFKQGLAAAGNQDYCMALRWFTLAYHDLLRANCDFSRDCHPIFKKQAPCECQKPDTTHCTNDRADESS